MTGTDAPALVAEILVGDSGFNSLRERWPLPPEGPHGAAFGTFDWFDAARQWQTSGSALQTICVHDAGSLAAVLPLVTRKHRAVGLAVREQTFVEVPDTQACDILVFDGNRRQVASTLAEKFAQSAMDWDVLRLRRLSPGSVTAGEFRDALERLGFATALRTGTGNAFVRLDGDWQAFYGTRSRRLKKANNLAASRLAKAGAIHIDWLAPGTGTSSDVQRFLSCTIDVSARSWKRTTGNALDQPGPQAFIKRLTETAHARGCLSIWLLMLDGRPIAMEYQLVARGNVYALRSDFDSAYADISPGTHLSKTLLERLFTSGLARYYMGPGENKYKLRWTDDVEPVDDLTVWNRTLRGYALQRWERSLKPQAASIRDRLKGFLGRNANQHVVSDGGHRE